jgi:hypothetical protein
MPARHLGHPGHKDEMTMLDAQQMAHPIEETTQVVNAKLTERRMPSKTLYVDRLIKARILRRSWRQRASTATFISASSRAERSRSSVLPRRAAILSPRDCVIPDDIKALAEIGSGAPSHHQPCCLPKNVDARSVVAMLLNSVAVREARTRLV